MPPIGQSPFELRHPVMMGWARVAAAAWLVLLGALLCSVGDWWGAALLLPAALLFWVGKRVLRSRRS